MAESLISASGHVTELTIFTRSVQYSDGSLQVLHQLMLVHLRVSWWHRYSHFGTHIRIHRLMETLQGLLTGARGSTCQVG